MTQQTWLGSDRVSEVLLSDIPDNETELFTRVEALETEVEDARDGESTLLAKQQAQDVILDVILDEVVAARDGEDSLLEKEQAQDIATAIVTAEVTAARDSFASLLAKEQDQDTKIAAAQVLVTTGYPSQTGKSGYSLSTDGIMPEWVDPRNVFLYSYDDRDQLRSLNSIENAVDNAIENTVVIVERLGFFTFSLASDEPDDDESCFDTGTGKWLLQTPSWDFILSILYSEVSQISKGVTKILQGVAFCAISSITTLNYASFSCVIEGADIGDSVIVTPPRAIGKDTSDIAKLVYYGVITQSNTITVYLCNASASTATLSAGVNAYWNIIVIKKEFI